MAKHKNFFIRLLVLVLSVLLLLGVCNQIFSVKYLYVPDWPKSDPFHNFYDLEKDSLDLIALGSSHTMNAVIPQALYDDFGIRSYNLSSEQQSMAVSYYWLREVLRFHHPKSVVLDIYMAYPFDEAHPFNGVNTWIHRPMDPMRWSGVKWNAVQEICETDPEQSPWDYYLPFLRFHSRWSELKPEDLVHNTRGHMSPLHGFIPSVYAGDPEAKRYVPFSASDEVEPEHPMPLMLEYLNRIVALCKEEDIRLLLISTPYVGANASRNLFFRNYAREQGVEFLDFNEETLYKTCDFEGAEDFKDDDHLNVWGADKCTAWLGSHLTETTVFPGTPSSTLENSREYYQYVRKNCELARIQDFDTYLKWLQEENLLVFLMGQDMPPLTQQQSAPLEALGIAPELFGAPYSALVQDGNILKEGPTISGKIPSVFSFYSMTPETASAKIDSVQYAFEPHHLQMLIWDTRTDSVIDFIGFDFGPDGQVISTR